MQDKTYADFRKRIFVDPYTIPYTKEDVDSLHDYSKEDKEHVFELLLDGLKQKDYLAVRALREIDPKKALPLVKEAFKDSKAEFRMEIVQFLNDFDPETNKEKLATSIFEYLDDPDWIVQTNAITTLRNFPTEKVIEKLKTVAKDSVDERVRQSAERSLIYIQNIKVGVY